MALCYSHSNNIVHKDLRPENIMLENVNKNNLLIKLLDCGGQDIFPKIKTK